MKSKKKKFEAKKKGIKYVEIVGEDESDDDDEVHKKVFQNSKLESTEVIDKFYSQCAHDIVNREKNSDKIDDLVIKIENHF